MKAVIVKANSFYKSVTAWCQIFPSLLDRRHLVFVHDLLMSGLALVLTFWMRVQGDEATLSFSFYAKHTFVYMLVAASIFLWLQLYRGVWRYISPHEIMGIIFAAAYACLLYFPLMGLMSTHHSVPRTAIFLLFVLSAALLLSSRIMYRLTQVRWFDDEETPYQAHPRHRVLLVGTFSEICTCLQELKKEKRPSFVVLGALSLHKDDVGRFFEGTEILGTPEDLDQIVTHFNLEDKHPHNLVLLGEKTDNFTLFHEYASMLPKLGLTLMHLTKKGRHSLELEPLSFKDMALTDSLPLTKSPQAGPQTSLSAKRILLFGVDHCLGQDLSMKLASQGCQNLYLSDFSAHFMSALDEKLKSQNLPDVGHYLPLSGSDSEDFQDAVNEAKPDLILAFPPLVSENYFRNYPSKSIRLIEKYMFGILESSFSRKGAKVVCIFPTSFNDYSRRYLNRYFNLLQAQMCQFISASKKKLDLYFLYTGEFAESPESLLTAIKTSLEREEKPTLSKAMKTYEFSSLERISEKMIDYLVRLFQKTETQVETHLQPDMVSTPQELLDQIKALYPLPFKAQSLSFNLVHDQEAHVSLKPFLIQKSEKTDHYLIKNKPLLNEILTKMKEYVKIKDDKNLLMILS